MAGEVDGDAGAVGGDGAARVDLPLHDITTGSFVVEGVVSRDCLARHPAGARPGAGEDGPGVISPAVGG